MNLGEEIGRGPRTVVYRGTHKEKPVAVKVWQDAATGERFTKAAERLKAVPAIPNLARVLDTGTHEGKPYAVVELVEGPPATPESVPPNGAAKVARAVAAALHNVHRAGFVHGGVKPSNVIVRPDGTATLLDAGMSTGVPADYVAPEKKKDIAFDIYALGRLLASLAGESPPEGLAPILKKATAESPAERYVSAKSMAEDLARFLRGGEVLAGPPPASVQASRWYDEHRNKIVAGVGAGALLLLLYFGVLRRSAGEAAQADLKSGGAPAIVSTLRRLDKVEPQDRVKVVYAVSEALKLVAAPDQRAAVLTALEELAAGEAVRLLVKDAGGLALSQWLGRNEPPELRVRVLRLLGGAKSIYALQPAVELLKSADADLRRAAIYYFTEVPKVQAFNDCCRALGDPAFEEDAHKAVKAHYDAHVAAYFTRGQGGEAGSVNWLNHEKWKKDARVKDIVEVRLSTNAQTGPEVCTLALQAYDVNLRLKACYEMVYHGDAAGRPALFYAAMTDPDDDVARVAAWALSKIRAGTYASRATQFLQDPREVVKKNAARVADAR